MPRFADEEYHRLSQREKELLLEIARLESEVEAIQDRLERLDDDYVIDHVYIGQLRAEGI